MDTISWIAVIGMMNILVALVWFLQTKDAKQKVTQTKRTK